MSNWNAGTGYYQSPPQDMYGGGAFDSGKNMQFDDITIRHGFIRKVYSILMLQLLVTFGFVSLCTFHQDTRLYMQRSPGLFMIAFVVTMVTLIAMACCESVRRQAPMNFIFLGLFTLAESFMLGVTSAIYQPDMVLMAVGITAIICFSLTLFSFQTKMDFTGCGVYLFIASIVLIVFALVAMFIPGRTVHLIYGCFGALLFSMYLVYDTQIMIGGKHKVAISPEEYIFAALNLYIDIVQIFLFILQILRATSDD